jgi:hypothetical protein
MKKILLAFAFFALFQNISSAQTLQPTEATAVQINTPKSVKISPIEKNAGETVTIIVEITTKMSPETFQRLRRSNRYTVEGKKEGKNYAISMPQIDKVMKVNGEIVKETVNLRLQANENYSLSKSGVLTYKNGKNRKAPITQPIEIEVRMAEAEAAMGAPSTSKPVENKNSIKPSGKYGDILIDDVPIPMEE